MAIPETILRATPAAAPPAQVDPRAERERVKALATQFEALFVSQIMQQMRTSMFDTGEDASSAPLADSLFNELSLAISRAGGIGLADSMLAPLQRQALGNSVQSAVNALPAFRSLQPQALSPAADPAGNLQGSAPPTLAGRISSGYGWRRDPIDKAMKFHHGMDIALPVGHEIPAAQAGRVVFAGEMTGYGLTVVLDHGGNLTTRYAHLSAIDVRMGDEVAAGQSLGKAGATGRTTGSHLHFEVLESGRSMNPAEKLGTYTGQSTPGL